MKTTRVTSLRFLFVLVMLSLLGSVVGLRNFDILLFVFSTIAVSLTMALPSLISSLIYRLVLATLLISCAIQLESLVLSWLNVESSYSVYLYSIALAAICLLLWGRQKRARVKSRIDRCINLSVLSLLSLLCFISFIGIFKTGLNAASMAQFVTYGQDNITHLIMVNDSYLHQSQNLSAKDDLSNVTLPSTINYPKGWHTYNAFLWKLTDPWRHTSPNAPNKIDEVVLYGFSTLLWFVLTTVSLLLAAFTLMKVYIKNQESPAGKDMVTVALFSALIVFVISMIFIAPALRDGFFSFVPVQLYLLCFILIALGISQEDMPRKKSFIGYHYLALLAAAGTLTWVLVGPLLFIAIALLFSSSFKGLKNTTKALMTTQGKWLSLTLIFTGLVSLLQVHLLGSASDSASAITQPGGITVIESDMILFFIPLAAYGYYLFRKQANILLIISAPLLIFCCFVFALLTFKGLSLSYYFHKSEYMFITVLLPLVVAALISVVTRKSSRHSYQIDYGVTSIATTMIILSVFHLPTFQTSLKYFFQHSVIDAYTSQILAKQLENESYDQRNTRNLYIDAPTPGRGIMATHLSRYTYPNSNCDMLIFDSIYLQDEHKIGESITECAKQNNSLTYVVHAQQKSIDLYKSYANGANAANVQFTPW